MRTRADWWLLLPGWLRGLPADLAAVVVLTLLTNAAVVLPVVRASPLRVVLGLPFVLFLPGYAFVAALFPEAGESPVAADETDVDDGPAAADAERAGIDGIERVALSFGLSIAIVPLIGLALNFTPWGIRLSPILASVSLFTLGATAVAARRRRELPAADRFQVPYREWLAAGRSELLEPETRTDAALNVLLALSVVLAVASVGYAVAVPKQGEAFTEFYLLTEDDGELVAHDYPTEYVAGEAKPVVVGIGNQEHEAVTYRVVPQVQRVEVHNNSTTVLERESLDRLSVTLEHNETWHRTYDVSPTMTGERLRLVFLLYRDGVPDQPTVESAYRETHLWINVSETEANSAIGSVPGAQSVSLGGADATLTAGA